MTTELEKNLTTSRAITDSMQNTNSLAIEVQRVVGLGNQFFKGLGEPSGDAESMSMIATDIIDSLNRMKSYIASIESVVATKVIPKV